MSHDPVIEANEIKRFSSFHFLDVRDAQSYATEHAAYSIRVPVEVWEMAAKSGETSFENVPYWENALSDLGVDPETPAVVYDDGWMTEAARVWFSRVNFTSSSITSTIRS